MPVREIRHPAASDLDLSHILRTVGDPVRLSIVRLLADDRERRCTEVGDTVGIPASTLSYHLRLLREAGLVDCERRGTWVYYWARTDALRALADELTGPVAALATAIA